MLEIRAPAKLNLVLEILGKRKDGFHEIKSILQSINLYDILYFKLRDKLIFKCNNLNIRISDNLIAKAASLLRDFSHYNGGAEIILDKHIPVSSGLGGGSSDAASTLIGLNQLWQLNMSTQDLAKLASKLGSDVPFFIYKGMALIQGKGEIVVPLSNRLQSPWYVILNPGWLIKKDKTKKMYGLLATADYSNGQYANKLIESIDHECLLKTSLLYNAFDAVVFTAFPEIRICWDNFEKCGANNIHLAGSGPTLFSMFNGKMAGQDCVERLIKMKYHALLVTNSL